LKIIKFGGSSVGSPDRIKNVIEIVRSKSSEGIGGIVFSAYSGVTDNLIKVAHLALSRDKSYITLFEEIQKKHHDFAEQLVPDLKETWNFKRRESTLDYQN
jgi:aspartokinase/homoserine dehydrogenase 1